MKASPRTLLERSARGIWYGPWPAGLPLAPLGWAYCGAAALRRWLYRRGVLHVEHLPRPVVVVGNLTVGGTGKTPLVIHLAELAASLGLRAGIVSRGYGGRSARAPRRVGPDASPEETGDEAVLLARRTGCAVAIGRDRCAAVRLLLAEGDIDLVLADDGLQHYRMARDLEIGVVDGSLGLGNRRCLPAGPLREPVGRLAELDYRVVNGGGGGEVPGGFTMRLRPAEPVRLRDGARRPLAELAGDGAHAVAGIGHPERFFDQLERAGLRIERHAFADHHPFQPGDLGFGDGRPVVMTEKDAVKCLRFADDRLWYIPVTAELEPAFDEALREHLDRLCSSAAGLSSSS